MRHFFVRDVIVRDDIVAKYVLTECQRTDMFIKVLSKDKLFCFRVELGMHALNDIGVD